MKVDVFTPVGVEQEIRQRLNYAPKNASTACIERWEDEGGSLAAGPVRRRTIDSIFKKRKCRQHKPSTSRSLMNYAYKFWEHATDQLIVPEHQKTRNGADCFDWHGSRAQARELRC
jgi:hypothetical protein